VVLAVNLRLVPKELTGSLHNVPDVLFSIVVIIFNISSIAFEFEGKDTPDLSTGVFVKGLRSGRYILSFHGFVPVSTLEL
jgi:hypothetical protein